LNKGILYAASAYVLWGLFPFYWKALAAVPASQILAHRIVWSLAFVGLILTFRQNWAWFRGALNQRRILLTFAISGTLLALNWFTYIWGVNAGFIVETSLGYFINPLVNVLLGYIFLKERLRQTQWLALGLALAGVLYLTFSYGSFPWIALTLAFSFGTYGLLRKTAALNSAEGLFLETAFLFIPAFGFLLLQESRGVGAFGNTSAMTNLLLIGAGAVTSVPLLLFAAGARRITLTTLGLLQYIAPTLQFLIGVLIYHEPFGQGRMIGFGLIWLALIFYSIENIIHRRRMNTLTSLANTSS
jgi:chloramphenicol-sensitive protein RarD